MSRIDPDPNILRLGGALGGFSQDQKSGEADEVETEAVVERLMKV